MRSKKLIFGICMILMLSLVPQISAEKVVRGWAYGLICNPSGKFNITYDYSSLEGYIVNEGNIILARWDSGDQRWYEIPGHTQDVNDKVLKKMMKRCKTDEEEFYALMEKTDVCDCTDNDEDFSIDEGYCGCPIYSKFDDTKGLVDGTTDLDNYGYDEGNCNYNMVQDLALKHDVSGTKVKWSSPVDVIGENYDNNVNMGDGFVSFKVDNLDETIDSEAEVTLEGVNCNGLELYYAPNFYETNEDIVSNGQLCDETTDPACDVISCANNKVTFTVTHFDSYGTESNGGDGPVGTIPEFSTVGVILALLIAIMGMVVVRKKQ